MKYVIRQPTTHYDQSMNAPSTGLPSPTPASRESLRGKSGRNGRSLANLLSEEFENKIRQGLLREGDRLPTESELVRSYDVSRTVVREAISKLQAAGLVETRHGIGTFVQAVREGAGLTLNARELSESVDVLAVLELRISLETEAAGLAAQRRSNAHLQAMRQALQAFERNAAGGGDTIAPDLAFHLGIAQATGNPYFESILAHFGAQLIPRTRITSIQSPGRDPDYLHRVNREHEEIFNAIERQDADSARAAMRIHLTNSRERLRLAQKRSAPAA